MSSSSEANSNLVEYITDNEENGDDAREFRNTICKLCKNINCDNFAYELKRLNRANSKLMRAHQLNVIDRIIEYRRNNIPLHKIWQMKTKLYQISFLNIDDDNYVDNEVHYRTEQCKDRATLRITMDMPPIQQAHHSKEVDNFLGNDQSAYTSEGFEDDDGFNEMESGSKEDPYKYITKDEGQKYDEENLNKTQANDLQPQHKISKASRSVDLSKSENKRNRYNLLRNLNRIDTKHRNMNNTPDCNLSHSEYDDDGIYESDDYVKYLEGNIEEEGLRISEELSDELSDDMWMGFFKHYRILNDRADYTLNNYKQCIEISNSRHQGLAVDEQLHADVRCFIIDLGKGTLQRNQELLLNLRYYEMKMFNEYGFPVMSTIIGQLTPRMPFTGNLDRPNAYYYLEKDDIITLTTKRCYSNYCTPDTIYVNARSHFDNCKANDCIFIGSDIQLFVWNVLNDELVCSVLQGGLLHSRLPVRFPNQRKDPQITLEELEDITFAREVGINVLISYLPGTIKYFQDLQKCLQLLKCDRIRLGTRIVLNDLKNDDNFEWIIKNYDFFYIDFNDQMPFNDTKKQFYLNHIDILKISSAASSFLKAVYLAKKPIILNPLYFAKRELYVKNSDYLDIYYYPDLYLFNSNQNDQAFYFNYLQSVYFSQIAPKELSILTPSCNSEDASVTDQLARGYISASYENGCKIIIVSSTMPDLVLALSHYRPIAPILYVSNIKSYTDYIHLYHNIVYLYFSTYDRNYSHEGYVFYSLIYGLLYSYSRHIINTDDQIMLAYHSSDKALCPDKYMILKFNPATFMNQLSQLLFTDK